MILNKFHVSCAQQNWLEHNWQRGDSGPRNFKGWRYANHQTWGWLNFIVYYSCTFGVPISRAGMGRLFGYPQTPAPAAGWLAASVGEVDKTHQVDKKRMKAAVEQQFIPLSPLPPMASSYLVGASTSAAVSSPAKLRHGALQNGAFAFPRPSHIAIPYLQRQNPVVTRFPVSAMAKKKTEETAPQKQKSTKEEKTVEVVEEEEVEEDLPWIQEKALDLVEFTGSVSQALPGPRVGASSLPWVLAVPMAYLGITFVIAFVKTVRKFNSPKEKRRKLVNKNATLCKSIDEMFQKGREEVQHPALKELMQKTDFDMEEVLRKYIRYALNEKPFDPYLVADLIQLRKASLLDDTQVAEILNEISRRIVRDKGPIVMDISGYSEKGSTRKLAVQALFGKIFYLSELPEFCSRDSSLVIKDIFGVTDEDAITLRTHTLSEAGDVESLQKMVGSSDTEEADDGSSKASED